MMVIALITITQANRGINQGLQAQQQVINRGRVGQQIGQAVLRDMAVASVSNNQLKDLLARHGFNVTKNNNSQQQGGQ